MNHETLSKIVALTELDGVGNKRALELYRSFSNVESLYRSRLAAFEEFHYIDAATHNQLQTLDTTIEKYQRLFRDCEAHDIDIIGFEDDSYPSQLLEYHAPLALYVRGRVNLLTKPSVSFTGSRETDSDGQKWARETSKRLADEGYVIVSGGAIGADTAAHEGAIEVDGETVVVLGTGIRQPYPEENVGLFETIVENGGAVISHRRPEAGPSRAGFLNRNKTNSGLSKGIVVVATDGSGGTMSQYSDAKSQEKQIFVPDSTLGLEPAAGVKEIAGGEDSIVIQSGGDIIDWYQRSTAKSQQPTERSKNEKKSSQDTQSTFEEYM